MKRASFFGEVTWDIGIYHVIVEVVQKYNSEAEKLYHHEDKAEISWRISYSITRWRRGAEARQDITWEAIIAKSSNEVAGKAVLTIML